MWKELALTRGTCKPNADGPWLPKPQWLAVSTRMPTPEHSLSHTNQDPCILDPTSWLQDRPAWLVASSCLF